VYEDVCTLETMPEFRQYATLLNTRRETRLYVLASDEAGVRLDRVTHDGGRFARSALNVCRSNPT
jgi:hypothetical protein